MRRAHRLSPFLYRPMHTPGDRREMVRVLVFIAVDQELGAEWTYYLRALRRVMGARAAADARLQECGLWAIWPLRRFEHPTEQTES